MTAARLVGAGCAIAVALSLLATPAVASPRLDTRFGDGGVARMPLKLKEFREFVGALRPARQADGKVLVGAQLYGDRTSEEFVLARFNRDGAPDTTFGHAGRLKVDFPWQYAPVRVLAQRDGRILLVGIIGGYGYFSYRPSQIGLVRLLPDGSRDRSFGSNGLVAWNPPWDADHVALDMVLGLVLPQSDGRLLIAALLEEQVSGAGENAPEHHSFLFVRFDPDGSVDESFGRDGMAELDRGGAYPQGWAGLPDGRLVALVTRQEGSALPTTESRAWSLQSFAPAGDPADGYVATGPVRLGLDVLDTLFALTLTRDGGLILIGSVGANPLPVMRRVLPDGSLDPTFGNDCGRPLARLRGSATRGMASASDGGLFMTATKLLIHARPRRVDGFAMTQDGSGCLAGSPLRLRGLTVGPPLLQGRRGALVGATFTRKDGLAGGVALIRIHR
jgi:uncharacterized delta-60 repeat protein